MQCPYCGGEMHSGEITVAGSSLHNHLIWFEGEPMPKQRKLFGIHKNGKLMQMPYVGMRFWLPADYCPKCKKMIFETQIIDP